MVWLALKQHQRVSGKKKCILDLEGALHPFPVQSHGLRFGEVPSIPAASHLVCAESRGVRKPTKHIICKEQRCEHWGPSSARLCLTILTMNALNWLGVKGKLWRSPTCTRHLNKLDFVTRTRTKHLLLLYRNQMACKSNSGTLYSCSTPHRRPWETQS